MSEMPATDGQPQQASHGGGHSCSGMGGPARPTYSAGSSTSQGRGSADSSSAACRAFPSLVPGAWPMMGGLEGGMGGGASMGAPNAAALAASLYPSWQQGLAGPTSFPLQALPMERGVSWGAELLPFIDGDDPAALAGSLAADLGGGGDSPTSAEARSALMQGMGMGGRGGGDDGGGGRPVHKQRFVWTGELHRRFEAAVNTLGVDQAKPQVLALPRKTRTPPAGTVLSCLFTLALTVFPALALPRCPVVACCRVVALSCARRRFRS